MVKYMLFVNLLFGFISFAQSSEITIKNIEINSEYPHFALMPIEADKVAFSTYLTDHKGRVKQVGGEQVLTVFEGVSMANGEINAVKAIPIDPAYKFNTVISASKSPDGKNIYITTRYTKKDKPKGNYNPEYFHIKVGEFSADKGWTNFKVLPFCNPKYSYAHPAISPDGKTMYFTSNIRGGRETTKGGSDIFKVAILEGNTYGEPKNLGSQVNSYSREMFPFMTVDNVLYFSSNRPNGFGGYDIYKSTLNQDGTFEKAEKLPKPFNSRQDDLSLIMKGKTNSGYIVSKRDKGQGEDDIYYFKY